MDQIGEISARSSSAGATLSPKRLAHAAHEFEAQMMKELLKPMTGVSAMLGGDESGDQGSGGVLGEFASEALGRALSEQGGFGIAQRLLAQLSHFGTNSEETMVSTKIDRENAVGASQ